VQQDWKAVGTYSTVGIEFTLSVVIGLLIGQWLDERFATKPWLTALWFCFGLAAGGRAIYRALQSANREAAARAQSEQEAQRKYFDDPPPR
jgi:F0F1-type ATP synthase assembly protein I